MSYAAIEDLIARIDAVVDEVKRFHVDMKNSDIDLRHVHAQEGEHDE